MNTDNTNSTSNPGYFQSVPSALIPQRCPTCGTCPTCGNKGYHSWPNPLPWYPWYYGPYYSLSIDTSALPN